MTRDSLATISCPLNPIWAARRPVLCGQFDRRVDISEEYYESCHSNMLIISPIIYFFRRKKNIDTIFPDSFLDAFGLIFPARPLGVPRKDHPFRRWRAFFTSASTDSVLSSNFVSLALNSSCTEGCFDVVKLGNSRGFMASLWMFLWFRVYHYWLYH